MIEPKPRSPAEHPTVAATPPGRAVRTPLILDIKGNALDDGPGIRTVVFFKGCPLSCVWCHNPESKRPQVEIAFDAGRCAGCDSCLAVCPDRALDRSRPGFVDRRRCGLCFQCLEACPSGALSRVGQALAPEAVVRQVLRDKPFFEASGGGVTLSGGEPTLYPEFAAQLLDAFRQAGVHTLVETCGLFALDRFMHLIYPRVDAIYYDIKLMDADRHRRYCGRDNRTILANFERVQARSRRDGVALLPRTPLIPGITDTRDNLKAIADFLKRCGADRIELLPYHPLWRDKHRNIGLAAATAPELCGASFMPPQRIEACRALFRDAGIAA